MEGPLRRLKRIATAWSASGMLAALLAVAPGRAEAADLEITAYMHFTGKLEKDVYLTVDRQNSGLLRRGSSNYYVARIGFSQSRGPEFWLDLDVSGNPPSVCYIRMMHDNGGRTRLLPDPLSCATRLTQRGENQADLELHFNIQ